MLVVKIKNKKRAGINKKSLSLRSLNKKSKKKYVNNRH